LDACGFRPVLRGARAVQAGRPLPAIFASSSPQRPAQGSADAVPARAPARRAGGVERPWPLFEGPMICTCASGGPRGAGETSSLRLRGRQSLSGQSWGPNGAGKTPPAFKPCLTGPLQAPTVVAYCSTGRGHPPARSPQGDLPGFGGRPPLVPAHDAVSTSSFGVSRMWRFRAAGHARARWAMRWAQALCRSGRWWTRGRSTSSTRSRPSPTVPDDEGQGRLSYGPPVARWRLRWRLALPAPSCVFLDEPDPPGFGSGPGRARPLPTWLRKLKGLLTIGPSSSTDMPISCFLAGRRDLGSSTGGQVDRARPRRSKLRANPWVEALPTLGKLKTDCSDVRPPIDTYYGETQAPVRRVRYPCARPARWLAPARRQWCRQDPPCFSLHPGPDRGARRGGQSASKAAPNPSPSRPMRFARSGIGLGGRTDRPLVPDGWGRWPKNLNPRSERRHRLPQFGSIGRGDRTSSTPTQVT